ncbi:hypothetical protein LIER_28027 [Lithospermum erythrorhizon]|uniref:HAT C-terminal dimerisation domain-containing protein n=1 Tax=Lithospermum erythrorhizon TaxID=34254 RepID=A0AAV3RH47_LITER
MSIKYDKYWEECDLLLSFGSLLDPRYRKKIIIISYNSMYPIDYEVWVEKLVKSSKELYNQYARIYSDDKGKGPEPYGAYLKKRPSSTVGNRKYDEFMSKTMSYRKGKTDLELYFEEPVHPNVLDCHAIDWCKVNEAKYKVFSKMAMYILSIPIITVASESTFSVGSRVIDKKRASMRRNTIEVLLCGGDSIKETYDIISGKDENDDPIELEYEKEYEMKDEEVTVVAKTSETGKTNGECKEIVDLVLKPNQKTKNGQPSSKVTKSKPPLKKVREQKIVKNMTCLIF